LPCSLAGLTIAEPLRLDRKVDGTVVFVVELFRIYAMLYMKFMIQIYFVALIFKNDLKHREAECNEGLVGLAMICVFVFLCAIFTELRSISTLSTVLYNAEHHETKTYHGLGKQKSGGAVMVEEKTGRMAELQKKYRPAPPPDMPQWNLNMINKQYKVFCTIIVVVPKVVITLYLGYAGAIFIAQCESSGDMILNTLAVNFIIELDTILYETFTSDATKSAMEHAEEIELSLTNRERVGGWVFNTVVYPLTVILTAGILTNHVTECEGVNFSSVIQDIKMLFVKGGVYME